MYSPTARALAQARIRRLTRTAIVLAGGATAFIWVTVAKEHPGASAGAKASAPSSAADDDTSGTCGHEHLHDEHEHDHDDHQPRIERCRVGDDTDEPARDHDDEPARDHDDEPPRPRRPSPW